MGGVFESQSSFWVLSLHPETFPSLPGAGSPSGGRSSPRRGCGSSDPSIATQSLGKNWGGTILPVQPPPLSPERQGTDESRRSTWPQSEHRDRLVCSGWAPRWGQSGSALGSRWPLAGLPPPPAPLPGPGGPTWKIKSQHQGI